MVRFGVQPWGTPVLYRVGLTEADGAGRDSAAPTSFRVPGVDVAADAVSAPRAMPATLAAAVMKSLRVSMSSPCGTGAGEVHERGAGRWTGPATMEFYVV